MKRNYGIDLLRVYSMIGVMTLHILGHGGVLENTKALSLNNNIAWLLEVLVYCSVDCFVLISGYVGIQSKYKYSNLVILWLQTELYSVLIMVFFSILKNNWNIKECVTAFLPIATSQYWFFTMYFGMMLFVPILSTFIEKTSLKTEVFIVGSLTVVCTTLSTINGNIFALESGYSVLWFVVLYMLGGTLHKIQYSYTFNIYVIKRITFIVVLFTWLSKIILEILTLNIIGRAKFGTFFIKYSSPTILVIGCGLLLIFSNIKCNQIKLMKWITPLIFSAYLIQDNKYVRQYIISDRFSYLAEQNVIIMFGGVLLFALLCFMIAILIDSVRYSIFNKLRIKERVKKIEDKIERKIVHDLAVAFEADNNKVDHIGE